MKSQFCFNRRTIKLKVYVKALSFYRVKREIKDKRKIKKRGQMTKDIAELLLTNRGGVITFTSAYIALTLRSLQDYPGQWPA